MVSELTPPFKRLYITRTWHQMRKEVLIAIVLGSFLGLFGAYLVWQSNLGGKNASISTPTPIANNSIVVGNIDLEIKGPKNYSINTTSSVKVSGTARPDSLVAVYADKVYLYKTANGAFEIPVELLSPINEIKIRSFLGDIVFSSDLLVVYSTEYAKTDGLDGVSYLGTVTDITENSLQIRTEQGVKQVSIDPNQISISNIVNTPKKVAFGEIAIGDFIIAMGKENGDDFLAATRIVITSAYEKNKKEIIKGRVKSISRSQVVLVTEGNEITYNLNSRTEITEVADSEIENITYNDVSPSDNILIFVDLSDDSNVEQIHIL